MAIFGSLADLGVPDLFVTLGRRAGVLVLRKVPDARKPVSIAITAGEVLWIAEGSHVLDPLESRSLLRKLLNITEGEFEFMSGVPPLKGRPLHWPIQQVLLSSAEIEDEISAHRKSFPDPRSRFTSTKIDIWLDELTYDFWERARNRLSGDTASAEELSKQLRMPLEEVQLYLYKLRLSGKIEPVRAYKTRPPERRGLWQGVLASLKRWKS